MRAWLLRAPWWLLLLWLAVLALGAWLAVTLSPWFWLPEVVLGSVMVRWLLHPGSSRRRPRPRQRHDGADQSAAGAGRSGTGPDGSRPGSSGANGSSADGQGGDGSSSKGPARHKRPPGSARPTVRNGTSDRSARHKRRVGDRPPA